MVGPAVKREGVAHLRATMGNGAGESGATWLRDPGNRQAAKTRNLRFRASTADVAFDCSRLA